jgi:hypothetical protein
MMMQRDLSRREVLKFSILAAAGLAVAPAESANQARAALFPRPRLRTQSPGSAAGQILCCPNHSRRRETFSPALRLSITMISRTARLARAARTSFG